MPARALYRYLAPALTGVIAVTACALQASVYGTPVPALHDEFSYLLAADTFRHGRCANPTHPLWQHFESMHILMQPSYASKYPPGQALVLAAGWLLSGHPLVGVWLSIGLACGAITWMLQAYVPVRWALVGGILAALRFGFGIWGWSYWGGGVAALGGALLMGAVARLDRRIRPVSAVILAVGLAILAVSRPFEGLLVCVPVFLGGIARAIRTRPPLRVVAMQVLLPASVVLIPASIAIGFYNERVTGGAFRLPYLEHMRQYSVAPILILQPPRALPEYRHPELREFYADYEMDMYRLETTRNGWTLCAKAKLQIWAKTYLGFGLALALLALPCVILVSPRTRFALLAGVFVLTFVDLFQVWGLAHYTAPVAGIVYLVVVQCFRCFSFLRWRQMSIGRWLVAGWLSICLVEAVFQLHPDFHEPGRSWAYLRAAVDRELRAAGGRHLVVVHYGPGHWVHDEWVYNEADIDAAPIVWAREMTPEMNNRLERYYADRSVWRLSVDGTGPHLDKLREAQGPEMRLTIRD
jgi:hypothetical protein